MSDLVERLRAKVTRNITMEAAHTKTLEWEAADRIAKLEAALRAIADQSGCGCKPVCHCNDNVGALLIFKEWAVETARAALTAQEKQT